MDEPNFKEAKKAEVMHRIPFFCTIGQIKATLDVLIEIDPIGNGKGRAAHYHAFPSCPKTDRSGNYPGNGNKCMVTTEVCPFWEPFGSYEVEPDRRNFIYISNFVRFVSFVEFFGEKIISKIFESKGVSVEKQHHVSFTEIIMLLRVFGIIEKKTYDDLIEIRKFRDNLLHRPRMLMAYDENILSKMVTKADKLRLKIVNIFFEQEKQPKS